MDSIIPPAMSVVLAVPGRYEVMRRTLTHLLAQSARAQLEVVIVAPSAVALALDPAEMEGFAGYHVVEVGAIRTVASANLAGLLQARAPVVAFVETHAYPQPGWAEALMRAHQQPWAAVGPAMVNANPASAVSWASFLTAYGRWLEPKAGPVDDLPGHNSSYKRALLLDYGPRLEAMLQAESALHWDLRARGHQLYLEPAARTAHVNPSLLSSFLAEMLYAGRRFAATRAQAWPLAHRALYVVGAPLIPLIRLRRILPQAGRVRRQGDLPWGTLALVALGLALSAWGEMLGNALGPGDAPERLCASELERLNHVTEQDRRVEATH